MVLKKYQVPGTRYSTQWKSPQNEPYRTVPCRTMQWKSAIRLPGAQGQLCQEHTVTQPTSFVPGHSNRADDSNCLRGASHDNLAPRGLFQGRYRPSAQSFSENAGPYGSGFAGTSVGSASHATHPVLAEAEGSIQGLVSRTPQRNGYSGLCIIPGPLEGPLLAKARCDPRHGAQKEGCHDRCFKQGLGSTVQGQTDLRPFVRRGVGPTHQLHRNSSSVSGLSILPAGHMYVLVRSDSRSVVSYINHQGGLVSKHLCTLANDLLVWAQNNLRSLKATYVLGKMNQGADMLSRNNVSSEEWTLHPLTVQISWEVFGRARVDLFASEDNSYSGGTNRGCQSYSGC